jgi:Flp pilus assembly protein TadG
MIEFLLVALLLFLMLFASIEFDRMLFVYTNLADAAKAGVRYAIVHGSNRTSGACGPAANPTAVVDLITNYTTAVDRSKLTVNVTYPEGDNATGNSVNVVVQYAYDPWVLLPLGVTLSATSRGVITW